MLLQTVRLLIRPYRQTDAEDIHQVFSNPLVMRHCEAAYTFDKTREQLAFFISSGIAYAVECKSTGRVIGHLLFKQMPGEEEGIYEIGWIFGRAFWGKGYAYEAARAMVDYGFHTLHLHKICSETIDTEKSLPLMKKLGMRLEGVFKQHVKTPQGEWTDVYWGGMLNPAHTNETGIEEAP